jgi:outer membrane protein assembly factor BamB
MIAVELATGKVAWQTPNPGGWGMTHSSIAAITHEGRKQYLYCATMGVVGVDASDGTLLWKTPGWKVQLANIPTPIPTGRDGQFLLTGGYGAGAAMFRIVPGDKAVEEEYRLKPEIFGAEQHTPIRYEGNFYGVIEGGMLVCLDIEGRQRWASGSQNRFYLGPYLIADGVILALNDRKGTLHMIEASPTGYRELARAKVLGGHDGWAPMALVNGKLLLRDLTEMVCLKVGTREP